MSDHAVRRLRKELSAFYANPARPVSIHVKCDERNMLNWSYLVEGPRGTPYEGGWYWGKLQFPETYPLAAPSVVMLTPSGRFKPGIKLCLSVSDFHPENWKPAWGFATVLDGLLSFMGEDAPTVGSIDPLPSVEDRQRLAVESATWNRSQDEFSLAFPDFQEILHTANEHCTETVMPTPSHEGPSTEQVPQKVESQDGDDSIPTEFVCGICTRLLLEPVSGSCGHTFCRRCLDSSVDYDSVCPQCRAPLVGGRSVNILVRDFISQRCPGALARRIEEDRAEMQTVSRSANSAQQSDITNVNRGPILALINLQVLPLPHSHVSIEFRKVHELQAVEYALQGGRLLGILEEGEVVDVGLGCCVEVETVNRVGAGHIANVHCVGKFRFRLEGTPRMHEGGFELGHFQRIHDEPLPRENLLRSQVDNFPSTTLDLAIDALALLDRQVAGIGDAGRHTFQTHFGHRPVLREDLASSEALEQFSFWLANAIVMGTEHRKRLMLMTNSHSRIQDCRTLLVDSGGRLILNLPGASSWMNTGQSGLTNILVIVAILLLLFAKSAGFF